MTKFDKEVISALSVFTLHLMLFYATIYTAGRMLMK